MIGKAGLFYFKRAGAILDTYTGAGVAYSVCRKLRTAYAGSAIRVKRLNDNTEQDIGFDGDGNLNQSALTTFVGANNAQVVRIYDQTANAIHLYTGGTENRIVVSGTVQTEGGKPCVVMNSETSFAPTGTITSTRIFTATAHYGIYTITGKSAAVWEFFTLNADSGDGLGLGAFGTSFFLENPPAYSYSVSATATNVNRHVFESIINSSSDWDIREDGISIETSQTVGALTSSGTASSFSAFSNATNVQELIIFPSNQSANRAGIYSNVSTYYS